MKRLILLIKNPFFILSCITVIFFWQVFIRGYVPFPGDLLLSEYNPWRQSAYFGYAPGAIPSKVQYFDVIREFYPWLNFTISELKKGTIPLWNPYNFSGQPHMANYLTAVFYPLNFIYFIFGTTNGYTLMIMLAPLLTSLFMYLYAQKIGISTLGSLLSALILAYSSYMIDWLEFGVVGHTLAWFPLVLYSLENLRSSKHIKYLIIFTFAMTASLFAGYPMDFLFYFIFVFLYFVYIAYVDFKIKGALQNNLYTFSSVDAPHSAVILNNHKDYLGTIPMKQPFIALVIRAFPCFVFPLLIGSIQLLPAITYFLKSARVSIPYDFFINNMLVQPFQLILTLIPDYFGNPVTRNYWLTTSYVSLTLSFGIAPLLFALIFISNLRKKNFTIHYREIFFIVSLFIIYLLIVKTPFTELLYRMNIPLFSTSSPTHLLTISIFIWSIIAGRGLDLYLKNKEKLYLFIPIILAFFVAWIGILFLPKIHQVVALRNTIYSSGIFVAVLFLFILGSKRIKLKKIAVALIIFITIIERFIGFQKFIPFVPKTYLFPTSDLIQFLQKVSGIDRFYGYGTAKIESNIGTLYQIHSTDGFGAINYAFYNGFIRSSNDGKIVKTFTHENRSIAEIASGYGEKDLPQNPYRLRILDALGVKYILDRVENPKNNETFPQNRFKDIWRQDGWTVYENLQAAPRIFATSDIRLYVDEKDFETQFFSSSFYPNKTVLIQSKDIKTLPHFSESSSEVKLISYTPQRIDIHVTTGSTQLLYISDTYDDGWTAQINDKPTHIYRANYALRGIVVPEGQSKISFQYRPKSFAIGAKISILAILGLFVYVIFLKRKT